MDYERFCLDFEDCSFCGWNSAFEESHILYCSLRSGCKYISSIFIITLEDDEGEPFFKCVNRKTGEIKIIEF